MQFGYIAGIETDEQFAIALLDDEIRDDGLALRFVNRTGEGVGGFLI